MAKIPPALQAVRTRLTERLMEVREFLTATDVRSVASETGISVDSVKQARKGAYFNIDVVTRLIGIADERKAFYEKTIIGDRLETAPEAQPDGDAGQTEGEVTPTPVKRRGRPKKLQTA